jgi:phage shock protein A
MKVLLLCLLLVSSSQSFLLPPPALAPHHYNVASTQHLTTPRRVRSTALNMGLLTRFTRVVKANLNFLLHKFEDPEKIMNQAVSDMQSDLSKVRQSFAEVTASSRRMSKEMESCSAMAVEWYNRANTALAAGDDELAKEALERRQVELDKVEGIKKQIGLQGSSLSKLYNGITALESKIIEISSKKEQMIARAITASSTKKVNDMLSGVNCDGSVDAFKKMEEKVEIMEAKAEVSDDQVVHGAGHSTGSLENRFKKIEARVMVESELVKMKKNRNRQDNRMQNEPMRFTGAVDAEFKEMKRHLEE